MQGLGFESTIKKTYFRIKITIKRYIHLMIKMTSPVSVAQLVATRDNLYRGRDSNPGFPTSPHIMCVNLATRLLDPKK